MNNDTKSRIERVRSLFTDKGFTLEQSANEILRFQAVDQLLASSAEVKEWGITGEKLYALTCESTSEIFGPITYTQDIFEKVYGPSFAVEAIEYIVATGAVEGLAIGKQWKQILEESLSSYATVEDGKILFAYVEEYAGLIDAILQGFKKERVVLYTASASCYDVLHKIYPLADIRNTWPTEETFAHMIAISSGRFTGGAQVIQELAEGYSQITALGSARFFVPLEVIYDNSGLTGAAVTFLMTQTRLAALTEWLPLEMYEFTIGDIGQKKVKLGFKELIYDTEDVERYIVKSTDLIPLPQHVILDYKGFNLVSYALSLASISVLPVQESLTLYSESAFSSEVSLIDRIDGSMGSDDSYRLGLTKEGKDYAIDAFHKSDDSNLGYFQFMSKDTRDLWLILFLSKQGKTILHALKGYCFTTKGMGQLLCGVPRKLLNLDAQLEILADFHDTYSNYMAERARIEEQWQAQLEKFGLQV